MVEGPMKHNPQRIILIFISLLLFSQIPFFSTTAIESRQHDTIFSTHTADLLIFLSPQYSADLDIISALTSYATAVQHDLHWDSQLIRIAEDQNSYLTIDHIIETNYQTHPVKACLMIGEDLDTPLSGDSDYLEQPSILPWATLGETTAYEQNQHGIICKPTTLDICISLLYPTHDLPYDQRKSDLLSALQKFTTQRHAVSTNPLRVYESSDINYNSKPLYQTLSTYESFVYTEDATDDEITASLDGVYSAFFVHGHSSPAGTDVSCHSNSGWFSVETLNLLQTPLFGADGCYTAGWWSNQKDNNILDLSVDAPWFGSTIFTSTSLQVLALGLLSQNGYSTPVSFLENVFPTLMKGTTLAESIIGTIGIGDTIIIGDPTFHFSI